MKGFMLFRHFELTLFPLGVTPEGCNPESSRSISESSKTGFTLIELLVVVLIIG
ncbi:MAG: prepilin-type N-terminal cleavage/methylation domain-containing protein, partial [Candidatus Avelusimicrobium sp.]